MDKYQGAGTIVIDRSVSIECSSVRVSTKSNASPVKTMAKGLAGRARGAPTVEIQIETAVPKTKLEKDYISMVQNDTDISVVVYFGGSRWQYDGWVDAEDHQMSVDAAGSLSCTVMSGPGIKS